MCCKFPSLAWKKVCICLTRKRSPLNRERSQCSESTEAEQQHFPSEPSTPPKQYSFPIPTTPNSLSTINTASLELNDLRPYQCSIGRESPPGHNRLRSSHHVRSAPLISGYYDNAPYTFDWDMERQKTSPVNMKDIEEEARSRAPGWWRGPRSIPLPVDIIEKITTAKVLFTERLENEEQEEYGLVSERSNPIVEGSPGAEYRPQPTVCTPIAAPIVHIPRPSGGPYGISEPLLPELGDDRPSRTASPPPPPAPKHVVPVARLPKLRVSFVPAPSNQTGRTPTLNLITPLPSKVPSQKGIPAQSLRPPVPASALPTMLQPSVAESSLAVHHPVPQGPRAKPGSSLQPQQTSTDHPYVTPRSRKRECLRCSKQQLREEDPELRHAEISYAVRLWYKYPIRMRSTDINYGLPLPCIPETKGAMATKKRRLQFGNSPYEDTTSESDSSYDHPLLRRRQGSISPIASDENNLGSKGQKSIFNIKKLKTVREKSTPIKGAEAGNVGRMRMKISESSMISMTERGRVNAAVEGNQQEGVIRNGVGSISSDLTMGMATESFVSNPFNEDEGVGEGRVIELFSGTSSNPAPAPSQRLEQLFDQAVDRNHDPKGKGKARGGRF